MHFLLIAVKYLWNNYNIEVWGLDNAIVWEAGCYAWEHELQVKCMRLMNKVEVLAVHVLPCILGGPGFSSTSPAMISSRGITTTKALSSRVPPPHTVSLTWEIVVPCQWQCSLPPPPLPFSLGQVWAMYCSISDRAMTVMQPLSTRGVSFVIFPTPHLATPGWYSCPALLLHAPGLERTTCMVVVEPNSSTPCGKINPHDSSPSWLFAARREFHFITHALWYFLVATGDVIEAGHAHGGRQWHYLGIQV